MVPVFFIVDGLRIIEILTYFIHKIKLKNLLHSLGLVYKSMRGMVTNSIDRDQWLNVTSESRDRIYPFFIILNFALGRNRTRDPRVPEPKRTPLGYILPILLLLF
jgi:hypothetical protein